MRKLAGIALPFAAIEWLDDELVHFAIVQATRIDIDAIGIGARHVETLDAADAAEAMFCYASVEGVFDEVVVPGQQAKPRCRHDQMPEAAHPAKRTVAVLHRQHDGRIDLKTHAPAMAAAAVGFQYGLGFGHWIDLPVCVAGIARLRVAAG